MKGIDFDSLTREREGIKESKSKDPKLVWLGNLKFLLQPFGSSSGYPLIVTNEDFRIEMGEHNNPNFFVTFKSRALWASSSFDLHDKFLAWAGSVGFEPLSSENLSRVDYCFDYTLAAVDVDENSFVTRSTKDSTHRKDGKPETFTFGKGDVVLRVYDKVSENQKNKRKRKEI